MNVTAPEKRWTDDRLDDLKETVEAGFAAADKKMDDGFARVDADIRSVRGELKTEVGALRTEMDKRFDKVDAKFEKVDARFEKLNERFDKLNWRLLVGAIGIIGALLGPHVF